MQVIIRQVKIASITIIRSFRQDFGDLNQLAESIRDGELLQPVGVTPKLELIFGERRLRACRDVLGWKTIPARVIDSTTILEGMSTENTMRKDFTVSERVAIYRALKAEIGSRQGQRTDLQRRDKIPEVESGERTDDFAAKRAGLGNRKTAGQPWEPDDFERFTREWSASCGANFIAVFFSQDHRWDGRKWLDESLKGYKFQQLAMWHAPNSLAPKSREQLKHTWEPIFIYRKVGSKRLVHDLGSWWTGELHDLDCHAAPVPQSSCGGEDHKQHPCQKPVSVMKWLINALSKPGEKVVSLFSGVSPCGIAALQLGRKYHGIETNKDYRMIAEERLRAFGAPDRPRSSVKSIRPNSVVQGDCLELIPLVPNNSINLTLTSPCYAEQRNGHYPGVPAKLYPAFTFRWMSALWDKLTDDGSVLIVIDPHVEHGELTDYVRRTEDALCDFGWKQHHTQIWLKRDRRPLGHKDWPRHCYEQILWFSKSAKPFCDPLACGTPCQKLSVRKMRHSRWTPGDRPTKEGIARVSDVIDVAVGGNDKGIDHPAMFPVELAERLIPTFSPPSGTILDCFCGSGSSLIAAQRLRRSYYGFDIEEKYVKIARTRLADCMEQAKKGTSRAG